MNALVIDVRQALPADGEGIADVHASAWREAYQGIIPSRTLAKMINRRGAPWWAEAARRKNILVLDVGGQIAGYATFGPARMSGSADTGEVHEIYLAPEYQGIGLGGWLFASATRALQARKYRRMLVRVLADNDRAACFYRRQGGREVARGTEMLEGARLGSVVFEWPLVAQ